MNIKVYRDGGRVSVWSRDGSTFLYSYWEKCPCCGLEITEEDLEWEPEVEADEGGVWVDYYAYCPYCGAEVGWKPGYPTDPDEPLRHEM